MKELLRMVDANANRAAEALRTLEDAARFMRGDGPLAGRLKSLRHEVRSIVGTLDPRRLAAARDVPGDPAGPGTSIASRAGAAEMVAAAASRLGESLRVLEESLRILHPELAARVEQLRYAAYDASASVTLACGSSRVRQWSVCLLLTESLCRHPWRRVLLAALDAGVDCVQVREKSLEDRALLERASAIVQIARPFGTTVIVNDRADVAVSAGADGVHLGRSDLPISAVRLMAPTLLIGASTHDPTEAAEAIDAGADYCGVGAMFETSLKPQRSPSGPGYLHWFVRQHPTVPHLAVGGITPECIRALVAVGCRGVAVSRAICAAEDPGEVVRCLRDALNGASEAALCRPGTGGGA